MAEEIFIRKICQVQRLSKCKMLSFIFPKFQKRKWAKEKDEHPPPICIYIRPSGRGAKWMGVFPTRWRVYTYNMYIPRTQMTLVLLVLEGWPSKIEVIWALVIILQIPDLTVSGHIFQYTSPLHNQLAKALSCLRESHRDPRPPEVEGEAKNQWWKSLEN